MNNAEVKSQQGVKEGPKVGQQIGQAVYFIWIMLIGTSENR
jgi:hypothetical protein